MLCCAAMPIVNKTDVNNANTIKALFIYNFTKQIEWPPESLDKSQFTICVFGENEVAEKLREILKGRKIYEKNVEIKTIVSVNEISGCQILFLARSKTSKPEIESAIRNTNRMLIITEEKKAPPFYSCINLVEKNEQMRFEINQSALKDQNLKISNSLLKLAINN